MPPPLELRAHPDQACPAVATLQADGRLEDGRLRLDYRLRADLSALRLAQPGRSRPGKALWRHTCFEAFVAGAGAADYHEFNFSPSGEWAGYVFTDYRQAALPAPRLPAPRLCWSRHDRELSLSVWVDPAALPAAARLQIGLSAVIETARGEISYWALCHCGERADFHQRGSFLLELSHPRTTGCLP